METTTIEGELCCGSEENDLLLYTLKLIWQNYLQSKNDNDAKRHWLQLFLYNFQFVGVKCAKFQRFLKSIPEEIYSYFLEQIYDIITKSNLYASILVNCSYPEDTLEHTLGENNTEYLELLKKNHNFAQLILRQPSDCSKILALRQFLTHQVGQRLLEFLLQMDIKLLASRESFCNLCINLFPNCPWNDHDNHQQLRKPQNVYEFIGHLQLHKQPKDKHMSTVLDYNAKPFIQKIQFNKYSDFQEFCSAQKNSDEISILLIQLLLKSALLENENNSTKQHAISTTILDFSLQGLSRENHTFSSIHNAECIKYELMKLVEQCLNNLLHVQREQSMQSVLKRLVNALQNNMDLEKVLYSLLFLIFGLLHNMVAIYSSNNYVNECLFNRNMLDENLIKTCLKAFDYLLIHWPPQRSDIKQLFAYILQLLLNILEQLTKYHRLYMVKVSKSEEEGRQQHKRVRQSKLKGRRQMHCRTRVSAARWACLLQSILVHLLRILPVELQHITVSHLAKYGTCCCHYNLVTYEQCLNVLVQLKPSLLHQKCVYKFLLGKILSTLFNSRNTQEIKIKCVSGGGDNLQAKTDMQCSHCYAKSQSLDFQAGLLQVYCAFYKQLQQPEHTWDLWLFLKHLKHSSHRLTHHHMAAGILAEIVLPIFRENKRLLQLPENLTETHERNLSNCRIVEEDNTVKLILECLSIFAVYLNLGDVHLIKAFYNKENIKHLEDLWHVPPLIYGVCELIKIGLDKITFLGEDVQEQQILRQRLITFQLAASDHATHVFSDLLRKVEQSTYHSKEFWLDNYEAKGLLQLSSSNILHILHVVVLQWTLNYELLKTSQYFYKEFTKIYLRDENESASDENYQKSISMELKNKSIIDILRLNYNALSAFLMLPITRNLKKSNTTNTIINNNNNNNKRANENNKATRSMENLVSTLTTTTSSAIITSSPPPPPPPTTPPIYLSKENFTFSSILPLDSVLLTHEASVSSLNNQQSFLHKLKPQQDSFMGINPLNESIVLYDIKNQLKFSTNNVTITSSTTLTTTTTTTTPAILDEFNNSTNSSTCSYLNDSYNLLYSVVNENGASDEVGNDMNANSTNSDNLFVKLLHIFGGIVFGSPSRDVSLNNLTKPNTIAAEQIDPELLCFYDLHGDCKRLLLKLFETTMAICVRGYQSVNAEEMQKHLLKLKHIILCNATSNWEKHAEEDSRDNLIIQALQSLLKIASDLTYARIMPSTMNSPTPNVVECDAFPPQTNSAGGGHSGGIFNYVHLSTSGVSFNYSDPSSKLNKSATLAPSTPNQQALSGNSMDNDYFSTRASLLCADSELEISEAELDDLYLTADEGYDADVEILELSETETDDINSAMWHSHQPSSRYRLPILHEGICHMVVEILIELSDHCCRHAMGWSDNLAQLINRLYVIRECLGGSLFLLKGFTPILSCNDHRLRELQQRILELIADLDTPDVLATLFGILASKSPPLDILVKFLHHICANTLKKMQPRIELEFLVNDDTESLLNMDSQPMTGKIDYLRKYHIHCQVITPLTRAPCIIPISYPQLWQTKGFTASIWLQVKVDSMAKSPNQSMYDGKPSACGEAVWEKTHILSVGTDEAMLCIYLSNTMHFVFETYKPNAELSTTSVHEMRSANSSEPASSQAGAHNNASRTGRSADANSSIFKAFQHTKNILLNSFTNMHLFNDPVVYPTESYFESTEMYLSSFRVAKNKWTHLTFSVQMHNESVVVVVCANGLDYHTIILPFHNLHMATKNYTFQLIALGDGCLHNNVMTPAGNGPFRITISNLMLFNRFMFTKETIFNLTAMGPDFTELSECQVGSWKPNYGYLNLRKMSSMSFGNFAEAMRMLRESRILCYTAQQPNLVMCYKPDADQFVCGSPSDLMLYGKPKQNALPSIQIALILCGGLSNLLYLFARVVEESSNSTTQAMALDILLKVAFSESQLYTEFHRNDYLSLIGYVIKTERCTKDVQLLKSIINNACSQSLVSKKNNQLSLNETTTAIVIYPRLFTIQLQRYSDWHRSGCEHSDVLDLLLSAILAVTREKHPFRDFNIAQLTKAGLMKELLNLCKVYVVESPNPVYISRKAADSFISIISIFAGSPPTPSLLDEIMKLLLLLHKPSECFITHDRSKFYFLLTAEVPHKDNIGLSVIAAATFKKAASTRTHPGIAKCTRTQIVSETGTSPYDLSRQARLQRLRNLHKRKSTYKRSLDDFMENLEYVADCTNFNRSSLRLLSPVAVEKWREKYKRLAIGRAFGKNQSYYTILDIVPPQLKYISRIRKKKRRYLHLRTINIIKNKLNMPSGKKQHNRKSNRSSRSFTTSSSNTNWADTSLSGGSKTSLRTQRSMLLTQTDFYGSVGVTALQTGLLLLLKDFLCLLPDNDVHDVLHHYIKIEFLLVLANHGSNCIRTAVIKLIGALTQRLLPQDLNTCLKNLYNFHLANQLTIHDVDVTNFETCLTWVTGHLCNMQSLVICDPLRIEQRFGLNALIALAGKSTATPPLSGGIQNDFSEKCFVVIENLFVNSSSEERLVLIEAGIIQSTIKALSNMYAMGNNAYNHKTEKAITQLLTVIGKYSLNSPGHINILWDIINMMSFYQQDKQSQPLMKGFRSVQAQLQLNWLQMFFAETNVPWNYKVNNLENSSLSVTENKTRLELLINSSAQFFTIYNEKSCPSQYEIELFEWLVSYSVATNQRCNNFIAWGLQPSQPRDLRSFIIDALWIASQDDFLPAILCDGKMIKALLWLSLLEDLDPPIKSLPLLCQRLGIKENDSMWNLENELQRLVIQNNSETVKQRSYLEKTIFKCETLVRNCIESSMITTRKVAELQNAERKLLMSHMKDYNDTHIYIKWLNIVRRLAHEGAPWYSEHSFEKSWELDDTEGPSRVHTRLRRCHLELDKRFFMSDYRENERLSLPPSLSTVNHYNYSRPLHYLTANYDQQLNISLNSQVLYNFPATYLPVDGEIDGEIIITDQMLHFVATYRCKYFYVNCDIADITEIWLKRHQHKEKAFEVYLDTNQSLFFVIQNQSDLKIMREVFCDKIVLQPEQNKLLQITQQWCEGFLTNWEYLMSLNHIAGRTYNDLMQYPVFPWILSNYTATVLDLCNKENFRNLRKPIAVQNEDNEKHYINNYAHIKNNETHIGSLPLQPYHYSSHYSNSGTVLHFLVRVPPFTSHFLRYQDNNFDIPDRTFHALNTTWSLASRDSSTDVKELIPEFFCLPEMFENFENFNFGCRQNGERVGDVHLPAWCLRDPRLFVLIHRQALESELVRNDLHHWIDLIFGFKQTGEAAVDAINVFHPVTYPNILDCHISDPVERNAVETMIRTYGQMPRQLFNTPHDASKRLTYQVDNVKQILPSVRGLRWGIYVGSPQLPRPTLGHIYSLPKADHLVSFNSTNVVYGLPAHSSIMQGAESDTFNIISWGCSDQVVRIQSLNKLHSKPKNLLHNNAFDDISACGCDPNSNQLWFGHKSGRISVYKCCSIEINQKLCRSRQSYVRGLRLSYNSAFRKITTKTMFDEKDLNASNFDEDVPSGKTIDGETVWAIKDGADLRWFGPTVLLRHTDEITCIRLSVEFKIVVSAGKDGLAVIWDLNNWCYIRTIERPAEIHHSPISLICISATLGDIVTIHNLVTQNSTALNNDDENDENLTNMADECFEVTEDNLDDFVNVYVNPNGKSIMRLHTINARYVKHIVHEDHILAVCYSFVKEGVGVNVIATAVEGGIIHLWSSWDLSYVTKIITGNSNIKSLTYSTHQHLVVLTDQSYLQVWETEGLSGMSPKFPQIVYRQ